jgi:hypothetical protein
MPTLTASGGRSLRDRKRFQQGFAKKTITSSTARRVGSAGASIRSTVKTECGAFPCAFMPAGLAALSGDSVPANAAPKAVRSVWKRADSVSLKPIAAQF